MLGMIKSEWCPSTYCISFKLETDLNILEKKALGAIDSYKVDLVVANELHTNKSKVIVYEGVSRQAYTIELSMFDSVNDIEEPLILYIIEKHKAYMKGV